MFNGIKDRVIKKPKPIIKPSETRQTLDDLKLSNDDLQALANLKESNIYKIFETIHNRQKTRIAQKIMESTDSNNALSFMNIVAELRGRENSMQVFLNIPKEAEKLLKVKVNNK